MDKADIRNTVQDVLSGLGDISASGSLRRVEKGTYNPADLAPDSDDDVCYAYPVHVVMDDPQAGQSILSLFPDSIKETDQFCLIGFDGTRQTYADSTYAIQTASEKVTSFVKPAVPDVIIVGADTFHVVVSSDASAGAGVLYNVAVRK